MKKSSGESTPTPTDSTNNVVFLQDYRDEKALQDNPYYSNEEQEILSAIKNSHPANLSHRQAARKELAKRPDLMRRLLLEEFVPQAVNPDLADTIRGAINDLYSNEMERHPDNPEEVARILAANRPTLKEILRPSESAPESKLGRASIRLVVDNDKPIR